MSSESSTSVLGCTPSCECTSLNARGSVIDLSINAADAHAW